MINLDIVVNTLKYLEKHVFYHFHRNKINNNTD